MTWTAGTRKSRRPRQKARRRGVLGQGAPHYAQPTVPLQQGGMLAARGIRSRAARPTQPACAKACRTGRVTDSLADPDTPPDRRIAASADRGMTGIRRAWRVGANVRIPHDAAQAGPHARAAPRKLRNDLGQGRHRDDPPPDQRVQRERRRVQGAIGDLGIAPCALTGIASLRRSWGRSAPQGSAGRGAGRAARGGADPAAENPSRPSDDARRPLGRRSQTYHTDSGTQCARSCTYVHVCPVSGWFRAHSTHE